jgi:hypothetical protein
MKLFVAIYNDARLLGHFLRHYSRSGVNEFYIAMASDFAAAVQRFVGTYNITPCSGLDVAESLIAGDSFLGTAAVSEMRRCYQERDEWVIIVDLDEFVEFHADPRAIAAGADKMGANVVRGVMVDRFSVDGRLHGFTAETDLSLVYPVKSRFIRDVMCGCDYKGVLVKGHMKPTAWHHRFENEKTAAELLQISHYKWIPGALDRLRTSYRLLIEAGAAWAIEYRRVLEHYEKHGRFAWETFGGAVGDAFRIGPTKHCVACGGVVADDEARYSMHHFGKQLCRTHQANRRRSTSSSSA